MIFFVLIGLFLLSIFLLTWCAWFISRPYLVFVLFPLFFLFTGFKVLGYPFSPEKLLMAFSFPILLTILLYKMAKKENVKVNISRKLIVPLIVFLTALIFTQAYHSQAVPSFRTINFIAGYIGRAMLIYFVVFFVNKLYKFKLVLITLNILLFLLLNAALFTIVSTGFIWAISWGYWARIPLFRYLPLSANMLGTQIVLLFPFSCFTFYYLRRNALLFLVALYNIFLSPLIIFSTLSRTSLLAMIVQIVLFIWLFRKQIIKKGMLVVLFILMVVLVVVPLVMPVVVSVIPFERFARAALTFNRLIAYFQTDSHTFESWVSLTTRAKTWLASIAIIRDYPLLGVGYDNILQYQVKYGSFNFFKGTWQVNPVGVHGTWFKFFEAGGILLGIPLIVLIWQYYKFLLREMKLSKESTTVNAFVVCALVSFAAFIVFSITRDPLNSNIFWFLIGLVLGGVKLLRINREDYAALSSR